MVRTCDPPTSTSKIIYRAETNDRARHLPIHPRQRYLTHRPSFLLRQLLHPTYNFALEALIWLVPRHLLVRLTSRSGLLLRGSVGTSELSGVERTPRDGSNAGESAVGVHLTLFLAVSERVPVLHGDELGPAILQGSVSERFG
jgi:hypothetical protein